MLHASKSHVRWVVELCSPIYASIPFFSSFTCFQGFCLSSSLIAVFFGCRAYYTIKRKPPFPSIQLVRVFMRVTGGFWFIVGRRGSSIGHAWSPVGRSRLCRLVCDVLVHSHGYFLVPSMAYVGYSWFFRLRFDFMYRLFTTRINTRAPFMVPRSANTGQSLCFALPVSLGRMLDSAPPPRMLANSVFMCFLLPCVARHVILGESSYVL